MLPQQDQPLGEQNLSPQDLDAQELIKRDAALALALAQEDEQIGVVSNFVRRSVRDPSLALLERPDVQNMLRKIRGNHAETVVLKIKDMILSDINSVVMDEILHSLEKNDVCQALYVQNLDRAIEDKQLRRLVELLKKRPIWCLNIGETYNISQTTWDFFCKSLIDTSITHLYVSEHVIELEMKNEMRENIRKNRKKHNMHCSLENIRVIERCTNMWWNPINSIRHQLEVAKEPQKLANEVVASSNVRKRGVPKAKAKAKGDKGGRQNNKDSTEVPPSLSPNDNLYWAEGVGDGGQNPWQFRCLCGEVCSSRENPRYYPVGRMYECTRCSTWSHVDCVLGPETSDQELEELSEVHCSVCRTQTRRLKMEELKKLNLMWIDGMAVDTPILKFTNQPNDTLETAPPPGKHVSTDEHDISDKSLDGSETLASNVVCEEDSLPPTKKQITVCEDQIT